MITGKSTNSSRVPMYFIPALRSGPGKAVRFLPFSEVPRLPTEWLWPQRIAVGKVTLLIGEKGLGKGALAIDLAARVSRGTPWPTLEEKLASGQSNAEAPAATVNPPADSREPATVLVVCPEDEREESMPARLEAAGADMQRVFAIEPDKTPPIPGPPLDLPERNVAGTDRTRKTKAKGLQPPRLMESEFAAMHWAIEQTPDCKLVVIDPMSLFLRDPECRRFGMLQMLLEGLEIVARERQVAIVVVASLSGRASARAIERMLGLFGPPAKWLHVWGVFRDRTDPSRRLMLRVDGNFAEECAAPSFRLVAAENATAMRVEWGPLVKTSVEQALVGSSKFSFSQQLYYDDEQFATQKLQELLSDCPLDPYMLRQLIGVAMPHLYRAADRIGVIKRRGSEGWCWMLPQHVASWEETQRQQQAASAEARRQRKNERARQERREQRKAEEAMMAAGHEIVLQALRETSAAHAGPGVPPPQHNVVTVEPPPSHAGGNSRTTQQQPPQGAAAQAAAGKSVTGQAVTGQAATNQWRTPPPSIFDQPPGTFNVDLVASGAPRGNVKSPHGGNHLPHEARLRDAAG